MKKVYLGNKKYNTARDLNLQTLASLHQSLRSDTRINHKLKCKVFSRLLPAFIYLRQIKISKSSYSKTEGIVNNKLKWRLGFLQRTKLEKMMYSIKVKFAEKWIKVSAPKFQEAASKSQSN